MGGGLGSVICKLRTMTPKLILGSAHMGDLPQGGAEGMEEHGNKEPVISASPGGVLSREHCYFFKNPLAIFNIFIVS